MLLCRLQNGRFVSRVVLTAHELRCFGASGVCYRDAGKLEASRDYLEASLRMKYGPASHAIKTVAVYSNVFHRNLRTSCYSAFPIRCVDTLQ